MTDQQRPVQQHHQVLVVQRSRIDSQQIARRQHRQLVARFDGNRRPFGQPHRLANRRYVDRQHVLLATNLQNPNRSGQRRTSLRIASRRHRRLTIQCRQLGRRPNLSDKLLDKLAVQSPLHRLGRLRIKMPRGVQGREFPRHQVDRLVALRTILALEWTQLTTHLTQCRLGRINLLTTTSNQVDRLRFLVTCRLHHHAGHDPWHSLQRQRIRIRSRDNLTLDKMIHPGRSTLLAAARLVDPDESLRSIQIRQPLRYVLNPESTIHHLDHVVALALDQ